MKHQFLSLRIYIKRRVEAGRVAQEVEHLLSKCEAPSSNPSAVKKSEREREREREREQREKDGHCGKHRLSLK
jgi:hypothetical protein